MKNASSRYSRDMKFCMTVDNDRVKNCTKFERNAASSLDATIQNRVILAFTVLKTYLPDTVET